MVGWPSAATVVVVNMRARGLLSLIQTTPLLLALVLWLCTLPVLLFIGALFLDWQATLSLVGLALVAELIACWFICKAPVIRTGPGASNR